MDPMRPTPSLLTKIGSILVHFDEAASMDGHPFDLIAFKNLMNDMECREWLAGMASLGLLPVKRRTPAPSSRKRRDR